jgi:hypothetical protein
MLQAFIQRGIKNPAKSVAQRHLVQAIGCNGLPFHLTENQGMLALICSRTSFLRN